jgi:hypothetical protein
MFQALLAHPQKAAVQTALGILRVCYVSWLHHQRYAPFIQFIKN